MSQSYIDPRYWDEVRGLPVAAQCLWSYLLTHRHALVPGLLWSNPPALLAELQLPERDMARGMSALKSAGKLEHDPASSLYRLPRAPMYCPKAGPTNIRGWHRHWLTLPECRLKYEHVTSLRMAVKLGGESLVAVAWDQTFGRDRRDGNEPHGVDDDLPLLRGLGSPIGMGDRMGDRIPPYQKKKKKKDPSDLDSPFQDPTPDPDPEAPTVQSVRRESLPFTVGDLLTTLHGASAGRVVIAPFDDRLASPITAVIRQCESNGLGLADVRLAGEWVAAGGLDWMDGGVDPRWVAKAGSLLGAIGTARAWVEKGRPALRGRIVEMRRDKGLTTAELITMANRGGAT